MEDRLLLQGNALEVLKSLPARSVDCVITSPPYYLLRDYGEETVFIWDGSPYCEHEWEDEVSFTARGSYENANVGNNKRGVDPRVKKLGSFCKKCGAWRGQLGHEPSPDLYIKHLADIFDKVYRVLKDDGNVFIVIGDTYASGGIKTQNFGKHSYIENMDFYGYARSELLRRNKGTWIREKQLMLIPYRLAIELQNRGWIVRDLIIWAKKVYSVNYDYQFGNGLPESTRDRLTKAYEVIIHAVKSPNYYFNKPKVQSKESTLKRALYGKSPGKYDGLPFYGGGGSINKPRQYAGKYTQIDPESVSSIRARLLRSKYEHAEDINIGSAISGRVLKNLLDGKEHTLVRKALTDVNGYLKQKLKESGLSIDELSRRTGIKKTTLEHYFRTDPSGCALPSREAWEAMKEVLGLCEYEECIKEEYKSVLPVYDSSPFVCNVVYCEEEELKGKTKYEEADELNVGTSISGRILRRAKEKGREHILKEALKVNQYLREKLKESGLSLQELSQRTGIKESTLAHFFRSDVNFSALPSKTAWEAMKDILNLCEYEECVRQEFKLVLPVLDAFAFVGNVVHCNTEPTKERHYAVMPSKLVEFLIRMGCKENGVVLDPFCGTGTVARVAEALGRKWICIEANEEYVQIAQEKLRCVQKRLF